MQTAASAVFLGQYLWCVEITDSSIGYKTKDNIVEGILLAPGNEFISLSAKIKTILFIN